SFIFLIQEVSVVGFVHTSANFPALNIARHLGRALRAHDGLGINARHSTQNTTKHVANESSFCAGSSMAHHRDWPIQNPQRCNPNTLVLVLRTSGLGGRVPGRWNAVLLLHFRHLRALVSFRRLQTSLSARRPAIKSDKKSPSGSLSPSIPSLCATAP